MSQKTDEVVRVRLRYPDVDTFVERFAANVTRGGIFLASREPRPVGDVLRFEVSIRDGGGPLITGEGRVTWVKAHNPDEPHKPYGMGVQFIYVDPGSRPLIDRLIDQREGSSGPVALPTQSQAAAFPSVPAVHTNGADNRTTQNEAIVQGSGSDGFDRIEDTALRRAVDRARTLAARTDDLEALLNGEPLPAVTFAQAIEDLPRLLAGGRRTTAAIRIVEDEPSKPDD